MAVNKNFTSLNGLLNHDFVKNSKVAQKMVQHESKKDSAIRMIDGRRNRDSGHNYNEVVRLEPDLRQLQDCISQILAELEAFRSGDPTEIAKFTKAA